MIMYKRCSRKLSRREVRRRRRKIEKVMRILSRVFTMLVVILFIFLITSLVINESEHEESVKALEIPISLETQSTSVLEKTLDVYYVTETCVESPIYHTYEEEIMMRYIVECEAHDLSIEHKTIIACVIINRLESDLWDYESISEVILDENQFSSLFNYYDRVMEPDQDTINAVSSVLNNQVDRDEVSQGAVFFYNPDRSGGYIDFFEKRDFLFEMDGHRFFR